MAILWKAVCYPQKINLIVIVATVDGPTSNRKLFRMPKFLGGNAVIDVVY